MWPCPACVLKPPPEPQLSTLPCLHANSRSRAGFPHIVAAAREVCAVLQAAGPATPVEVDSLLQREALDVIGRVGFAHDFRAIQVRGRACVYLQRATYSRNIACGCVCTIVWQSTLAGQHDRHHRAQIATGCSPQTGRRCT